MRVPHVILIGLPALSLLAYLTVCALLYVFQRSLIYFPQPRSLGATANAQVLAVSDARLVITTLRGANLARPATDALKQREAIIYFGGNADDVSAYLEPFAATFPEHALYLMHYRGYGGSTGAPSEEALARDALALFDGVQRNHNTVRVMGRSLGSGVAVRLASARPVASLVLVTPYDSVVGIGQSRFPWVPVTWLLKDRFESGRYAANIRAPCVLITAQNDTVVPAWSSAQLLSRFLPGVARLEVIPGTAHDSIVAHPQFMQRLRAGILGKTP